MDQHQLDELIDDLLIKNQHEKAETILMREYEVAKNTGTKEVLDKIFGHLIFVSASSNPPNVVKGRKWCVERERNIPSAYNILQTAMFEYYTGHDCDKTVAKLRDAVRKGEEEGDVRTVYSSLGMLGRALLDLGRTSEVANVLKEIEQMLLDKKPFVVGDETAFLESAHERGIELESVKRIATALAPLCRDPEFKRRLSMLASM